MLSDGSHCILIYRGRFCLASAFGGECNLGKWLLRAMVRLRGRGGEETWRSSCVACGGIPHGLRNVGDNSPSILERFRD